MTNKIVTNEKLFYSWNDFETDCYSLEKQIDNSRWIPDYIVGIKRGGLIPAVKLSHLFGKPLILVSCQTRDGNSFVDLLEAERIPKQKNILIVDDICDSGLTFEKIVDTFIENNFLSIRCCALYYNTSQPFTIDYNAREIDRLTDSKWIVFPWEI